MSTGTTLTASTPKAKVADVVEIKHHNGPILLPTTMQDKHGNTDYDPAIEALMQAKQHALQTVVFSAQIDAFPWEVSIALMSVLEEMFGSATLKTKMGWFGPQHPAAREVKVGPGPKDVVLVPWGAPFNVPGLDEVELNIGANVHEGRLCTVVQAEVSRKNQSVLQEIVDAVREHIAKHSIYKGKILQLSFDNDAPSIDFIALDATEHDLVYNKEIEETLATQLYGFIRYPELWRAAGMGTKRGALFVGPYGTGKSAQIRAMMREAIKHGWTSVYLKDSADIAKALPYIQRWGRCFIGGEDLDKVANRDTEFAKVQALSLVLDGVTSYSAEVLLICTSNNLDHIHPILRRHGRFDITVLMGLPNAEAGERLLRLYAGDLLAESADLRRAGIAIAGLMPSTIREVITRAKAAYIARQGNLDFAISGDDMYIAASSVAAEQRIAQKVDDTPRTKDEVFGYELGKGLAGGLEFGARVLASQLQERVAGAEWDSDDDDELELERLLGAGR